MSDVRTRAADVIEQHVTSSRRRRESAEAMAADLDFHGYLTGSPAKPDAQDRVAAQLQCRMSWPTAEKVAAELVAAGLLAR